MSSVCLLRTIDATLDTHIASIENHDEREEALVLHRGLKSLIVTSLGASEQLETTIHLRSTVSQRRIEDAISAARRLQIIDAAKTMEHKASKAVRSMAAPVSRASPAISLNITMQPPSAANVMA